MVGFALLHEMGFAAGVSIYLDGTEIVPMKALLRAKWTVTSIFSAIGVHIRWSDRKPSEFACPASDLSVNVRISDRINRSRDTNGKVVHGETVIHSSGFGDAAIFYEPKLFDIRPELLGHVLVHEIGHALQGVARHSDTGIMKATWTGKDRNRMGTNSLTFTQDDADLIRSSIARVTAARVKTSSCAETVMAGR